MNYISFVSAGSDPDAKWIWTVLILIGLLILISFTRTSAKAIKLIRVARQGTDKELAIAQKQFLVALLILSVLLVLIFRVYNPFNFFN